MLTALHIRDFAIIEEVSLTLAGGLTVLTGETGAGKSILVDALEMVLGGRGDAAFIRHGAERAEINASFALAQRPGAREWLVEQAMDDGEDQCHLRRVIQADGRSRGFINGRPAPMQSLKDLGERLVEIHGQHEHQSLMHRGRQLALVDDYGNLGKALEQVGNACRRVRGLQAELDALPGRGEERDRQLEYLRHQVNELESLDLKNGEIEKLEADQRRLTHSRDLLDACGRAAERLDGETDLSVTRLLGVTRQELESLLELDASLKAPLDMLESATIQAREAGEALSHYLSDVDLDPERLAAVEERLGAAYELARKHRVAMDELPEALDAMREELDSLESADERRQLLLEEIESARRDYERTAGTLHERRVEAAERFQRDVSTLMESLGMKGGGLEVELEADPARLSEAGTDSAEFLIRTNPGQPALPLRRIASGGELSRIALAIQVAVVSLGGERTLIFDEVDAGVGGAVAEIVGQKLRRLGEAGQALCVTHLPQVAAQGHHHLRVSKGGTRAKARTSVMELETAARTDEVARMLGGVRITEKTTEHAREMLERAAVNK